MAETDGYDLGVQQYGERARQAQQIAEDERTKRQAKMSAIVGDSLNALPLPKDDKGNPDINNPAYNDILQRRQKLIGSLIDQYNPVQHANIVQRIGGLITGNKQHAMPHHEQPLPAMGTGPSALSAQAGGEQAAEAAQALQQNQIPQQPMETVPVQSNPFTPLPDGHPANKIMEGIKSLGAGLKNHAQAFAHPDLRKPDQSELINNIASSYADPQQLAHERNMELWGLKGENALDVAKERTKGIIASLAGRKPTLLDQKTIPSLLDFMKIDPDTTVYGPNGELLSPAQLSELPPNSVAREWRAAGGQTFYAIGDQNSKTLNVGGRIIDIPALGKITPQNSTDLGQASGTLEKAHQVLGATPGDNPTLTAGVVATPGMVGAPPSQVAPSAVPAAPAGEPPNPTLHVRPTAAPTLPPSPSQQAVVDKTNKGRSQSKQIPQPAGTPVPTPFVKGAALMQARPAMPVISAMNVVGANIFGSSGEKPIWENAWMYDKPELRKALNNALTLNALRIPGSEDESLLAGLKATLGLTQASQEAINDAAVQARNEVERLGGPEALKQFAREAAMQEDLPALRAATKASAAQGSLALAVRSAPVYNVASAQDFRNQLGTLLSTATSSMKGYPMINPEYVKWWDRGVSAAKGGPTSASAPKTPSATNSQVYEMNGKRYTYNGSGKKSDMKNYTEVPSGR